MALWTSVSTFGNNYFNKKPDNVNGGTHEDLVEQYSGVTIYKTCTQDATNAKFILSNPLGSFTTLEEMYAIGDLTSSDIWCSRESGTTVSTVITFPIYRPDSEDDECNLETWLYGWDFGSGTNILTSGYISTRTTIDIHNNGGYAKYESKPIRYKIGYNGSNLGIKIWVSLTGNDRYSGDAHIDQYGYEILRPLVEVTVNGTTQSLLAANYVSLPYNGEDYSYTSSGTFTFNNYDRLNTLSAIFYVPYVLSYYYDSDVYTLNLGGPNLSTDSDDDDYYLNASYQ